MMPHLMFHTEKVQEVKQIVEIHQGTACHRLIGLTNGTTAWVECVPTKYHAFLTGWRYLQPWVAYVQAL